MADAQPMNTDAALNKTAVLLQMRESSKALAALRRFVEIDERGDPRLPKVKQLIEAFSR
jgi:hypothetical protein